MMAWKLTLFSRHPVEPIGGYLVSIGLVQHLVPPFGIDLYLHLSMRCLRVVHGKTRHALIATDRVLLATGNQDW